MKKTIVFIALLHLIYGCKPEQDLYSNIPRKKIERAAKLLEDSGIDTCGCRTAAEINACPNGPANDAIKQYIPPPATHSVYTISWKLCLNSQDKSSDCNREYKKGEVTSTIDICWRNCETATVRFTGKPPCLPCYPDNFCIQLKGIRTYNSNSSTYELSGSFAGQGAYEGVDLSLTVVISTDPDITINCTTNIGTSNQQVYTCYGSF